jgi:hypothetical protein
MTFVPVDAHDEACGPLTFSGRAEDALTGAGFCGDGLWREQDRADGGTLFLLVDVEGKGPPTAPLREVLELALDDDATRDRDPGELLVELHSQAAAVWAENSRYFHAQAVLVLPEEGCFLVASAGIPYPYHAADGRPWQLLEAPSPSCRLLGRPDLHDEGGPIFPARRVAASRDDRYLACTDGVTESGRLVKVLGAGGLLDLLNAMPDRPGPDELLGRVFDQAAARDGSSWPGDDSTAVAWRL